MARTLEENARSGVAIHQRNAPLASVGGTAENKRSADGNDKKAKKESKKLKIAKAYIAKVEKEKDSDDDSEYFFRKRISTTQSPFLRKYST